jgi:ubiquitin-protein ligase
MKQEGWSPYWNFISIFTKIYRVLQEQNQETYKAEVYD